MSRPYRNTDREEMAWWAANSIRHECKMAGYWRGLKDEFAGISKPEIGIILGTGWGDVFLEKIQEAGHLARTLMLPLETLLGFKYLRQMPKINGHHRELWLTALENRRIAMLRGRIHMNETHNGEELAKVVRLQVETLLQLGVKHLILTNAAGSLLPEIKVGDIVAHDAFVTPFSPRRPLWAGEFDSPEDMLKEENVVKIQTAAKAAGLAVHTGAGAMVCGPDFEGRKHDKRILRESGASMAMMSILPEAAVAALYPEVKVYALSFITNSASEEHSHEENQKRAKESSGKLGDLLLRLIRSL